jgi:hypothetical protein
MLVNTPKIEARPSEPKVRVLRSMSEVIAAPLPEGAERLGRIRMSIYAAWNAARTQVSPQNELER